MKRFRTFAILFMILFCWQSPSEGSEEVRIGVLAKRGVARCMAKWQPTADYLNRVVPSHEFVVVPLGFSDISHAVSRKQVDFILTNSSFYVELQNQFQVGAVATLKNRHYSGDHTLFGGVIFTQSDNPEIHKIKDLPHKNFMAVEKTSFGGWRMAWREMLSHGINPFTDLSSLSFGGTHDAVVYAVQNRRVDAGTVRTDTLERMAAEGKIDLSDFRILHSNENKNTSVGFNLSTHLYPEWPMAKLPHVSYNLGEDVAHALLMMPGDDGAATAANCAGWTYPLSYQPVHECLKALQVGPYDPNHRLDPEEIFRHYQPWIISGVLVIIGLLISAGFVIRLNNNLSNSNKKLVNEIQRRKLTEDSLMESEDRLRTILDHCLAGTIIIDRQSRRIVDANTSALELYGSDREALVGQLCYKTFCQSNDGQCPATQNGISITKEQKKFFTCNGQQKDILKTVAQVNIQGKAYLVDSFIDITALKEVQANLEFALSKTQAASEAKSQFLANMSHEIRTPMNGVIGMNSLLMETNLSDEQQEYVQTIQSSSDALMHIINDILDFSKMEKLQIALETMDFELPAIFNDLCQATELEAQAKGLEFTHLIDSQVPIYLKGDTVRLGQILKCMLDNAVKFTNYGEVFLHIALEQEEKERVCLRFTVKDTGIGIRAEQHDEIFQSFNQADNSHTRNYGGSGLGLTIAKHLVNLMNGEIHLESAVGKGTTFWFTAWLEKQSKVPKRQLAPKPDISDKRILVVDDNPSTRQVVESCLQSWSLRFASAENASNALAELHRAKKNDDPFDLAVISHLHAQMDSYALGATIVADPMLHKTRMIMLAVNDEAQDIEQYTAAGFAAYLTQPIESSHFYHCLQLVFEKNQSAETSDGHQPQNLITRHTVQAAEQSGPRVLVAEDNFINQKVIQKILDKSGCQSKAVHNGLEAVETLRSKAYDVVLMDLQMPVMDGFEATADIRNPGNKSLDPNIPIIALTASTQDGDRQRCFKIGFDDYLSKPVNPDQLMACIAQWIKMPQHKRPSGGKIAN